MGTPERDSGTRSTQGGLTLVQPVALAIGGHDPTNGAGVVADAAVIAAHGVHPLSVITGLTEQDSSGVGAVVPTDASFVRRALDRMARDFRIAAVKIGMLASVEVMHEVVAWLDRVRENERDDSVPVVVDPVIESSDGSSLLLDYRPGVLAPLVKRATIVTPNLSEATRLTGMDVQTNAHRLKAARALTGVGARAVLVKGGHAEGAPADLLVMRETTRLWTWERVAETPHGTGCATASAIAANLALGRPVEESVNRALHFVQERIRRAARIGRGRPLMPLA